MAQPRSDIQQVLVIDGDARVCDALAALIDATPGLHLAATTSSTAHASVIASRVAATVAIVDLDAAPKDDDLTTVRMLAERLPVVAVGRDAARAAAAGATTFCDKNGDPDTLTAAVTAAARAPSVSVAWRCRHVRVTTR